MTSNKSNIRPWQVVKIYGCRMVVFALRWYRLLGWWLMELIILYWRYIGPFLIERFSQVLRLGRLGYWAGFCSEARGLSWDRKSRYGKK